MILNLTSLSAIIVFIVFASTSAITIFYLSYCKKLTYYMDEKEDVNEEILDQNKEKWPFISIIIPTYNESILIDKKLQNTLSINYPNDKREIIVIDSASTDGTAEIAEKFEDVKIIREKERKGKSSALAKAFACVHGEIILITDADAMLESNVLQVIITYLSDDTVGAVTGKQVLMSHGNKSSRGKEESYRDVFDIIRNAESNMEATMIFNGPLMAFKKNVLEAPAKDSVADDTEMAINVIRKGYRTLYARNAIFYENVPLSDRSRLKQKERRAQGLVQSFWRHRDLLFNKEYGRFGMEIFPAEFAVHIVLPFALSISILILFAGFIVNFKTTLILLIIFGTANLSYAISTYQGFKKHMKNNKSIENGGTQSILITIISFLQLQYCLLIGALKLLIFGGHFKWDQISDVRYKQV